MGASTKKQRKLELKLAKKAAKARLKAGTGPASSEGGPSPAVRFAEMVRGGLLVVVGASLIAALVLGERGALLSLDDIVDGLFAARAGKILLALIAVGLILYGLKYLRVVR